MSERQQGIYDRAAALWVARNYALDAAHVESVSFDVDRTGYCDTCAGEEAGISFTYHGKRETRGFDYGMTAGAFIEACVALLPEVSP